MRLNKLKRDNKMYREEVEGLTEEKNTRHKRILELEKQLMEGFSKAETQDFNQRLQTEKIEKLKAQVLKLQKQKDSLDRERDQGEEGWETERENWAKERALKEEMVREERRRCSLAETKCGHKDEFIEKLLDMLKIPLKGYKEGLQR